MGLLPVLRNGHPDATICPMYLCDYCGFPLSIDDNAYTIHWTSTDERGTMRVSPLYMAHSSTAKPCMTMLERELEPVVAGEFSTAMSYTIPLVEVLEQALNNLRLQERHKVDLSDAQAGQGFVQYVAPVSSSVASAATGKRWSAVVWESGQVVEQMTDLPPSFSELTQKANRRRGLYT